MNAPTAPPILKHVLTLRDVSIVDPGWGLGFVIVAWIAFGIGEGCYGRRLLLAKWRHG
jgi:steroid 5-alpha reductase family enzyme